MQDEADRYKVSLYGTGVQNDSNIDPKMTQVQGKNMVNTVTDRHKNGPETPLSISTL